MKTFFQKLGENIRNARLVEDMTQEQLAQQVGVSSTCVSQYESGRRRPNAEILAIISEILCVSLDYLIPDAEHSFPVDPDQSSIYDLIGE